jgi:hypothetical protein
MADVLGVSLIPVDEKNVPLTDWQVPKDAVVCQSPSEILPPSVVLSDDRRVVVESRAGERRFFVRVVVPDLATVVVQSEDLPRPFPWVGAPACAPELPGLTFSFDGDARFFLDTYISAVCRTLLRQRCRDTESLPTDLDLENIRRIGIGLRENFQ